MFAGVMRQQTIAIARTFAVPNIALHTRTLNWGILLRSMLLFDKDAHYSAGVCAKIENHKIPDQADLRSVNPWFHARH